MAVWCGMDYRPYYTLYLRVERRHGGWTDRQLAFVGFLFGVSQGVVERSLRERQCNDNSKTRTSDELKKTTEVLQRRV
jgi:hypothetical protein